MLGGNGAGKSTLVDLITGENQRGYGLDISLFGRRKGSGESVWDVKRQLGVLSTQTTPAPDRGGARAEARERERETACVCVRVCVCVARERKSRRETLCFNVFEQRHEERERDPLSFNYFRDNVKRRQLHMTYADYADESLRSYGHKEAKITSWEVVLSGFFDSVGLDAASTKGRTRYSRVSFLALVYISLSLEFP